MFHFKPRWNQCKNVRPFALIVGATGAIGSATAQAFASLGFSLVLVARDSEQSLDALREKLFRIPIDSQNESTWIGDAARFVHVVRCDLSDDVAAIRVAIDEAIAKCANSLEVAVFCAGTVEPHLLLDRDSADHLVRDLHVDVLATAVMLQACGTAMASRDGGTIVLISNTIGVHSFWQGGVAIAGGAIAKQAMAESAFEELRLRGVRVCTLLAEQVDSKQTDHVQRFNANIAGAAHELLQPADIARGVVFCAGSRSTVHELLLRPHINPVRSTKLFARMLASRKMPEAPVALVAPRRANGRLAAIVTGASQGIGLACAERLARDGYDVALLARSPAPLEAARVACLAAARSDAAEMRTFQCDVGQRVEFEATMQAALAWLGRCDVLVANAGTNRRRTALNTDWRVWMDVLDTNLGHAVVATALVLPWMVHQRGGTIAMVSSYGGGARGTLIMGDPGIAAYPASKSALVGFCASVFEDCREHGIKVTQLALGLVSTPLGRKSMGGIERRISPDDMVQAEEVGDQLMFVCNAPPTCAPTTIKVISTAPPNRQYVDPKTLKRADDRQLRLKPKL
jgi:NAD(P)-dependent dehydrogenase (short-subunit alcohol dehydrogenase family)